MIDIEALAAPAFLIELSWDGNPVGLRLNTACQAHPELQRCLATTSDEGHRQDGGAGRLVAALRVCAAELCAAEAVLAVTEGDGTAEWCASLSPVTGQDGPVTTLLGICRRTVARQPGPARRDDHLSLALKAIHGAEWCYDVGRDLYRGSDEIATLLGESLPRPVAWAEWLERVHPQDLGLFLAAPAPEGTLEFRFRASGGDLRWARCSRVAVTGETGAVEAVLGIMVDITQERIRETAWAELATHDPLTGLLNRRGLRQEIDRMAPELPPGACLALYAIDLDQFKTTNDENGHGAGDAVLVETARRLTAAAEGMICARLGGDEFVVVSRLSGEAEAHRLRDRLSREFRRPLAFRGRWLPVSASVGVACMSRTGDIARLMDSADADLYARKRARMGAPAAAA